MHLKNTSCKLWLISSRLPQEICPICIPKYYFQATGIVTQMESLNDELLML